MNNEKDTFFKGFLWKFTERFMSSGITFIVSIVLARLLTPKDYGAVALVNVFIIIANVFVTTGFGAALIQKKEATSLDFSTIFYCSLIFSFLIYGLIYVAAIPIASFYHNADYILILRILALKLPVSAFNSIQQAYVSRHMAFQKIFVSTTVANILSGVIGISFAYLGFGVWALVAQYLSEAIFETILLFTQIPWRPSKEFSVNSAKNLMSFGWKVLMTSLIGTIFNELRSLIIGRFYTPADLAYYNRGARFPDLISQNVDGTISTVLFPAMSLHSDDLNRLRSMIRRSMKTSTYIIMPIMFGLAVAAKPVIILLLTAKWLPSVPYMQCLCIATAFGTLSNANMEVIKASGRSDVLLMLEFLKKPVYLIILLVSIKISVFAVASSMIVYSIIAMVINAYPNKKIIQYSYFDQLKDVIPALTLSIITAATLIPLQTLPVSPLMLLIIDIMVGVIIYIALSVVFKLEAYNYLVTYLKQFLSKIH